jgi:hypothetical protein
MQVTHWLCEQLSLAIAVVSTASATPSALTTSLNNNQ